MAELHVQRKATALWPWILVGLVALAMLFWFMWRGKGDLDVGAVKATDSTVVGAAVTDYLQFVDARSSRDAGLAHEYTAHGLRLLAAAIKEIARGDSIGGVALQPRIDEIRQRADAMQQNPNSRAHALQVREAFILASNLITQMNRNTGTTAAGNLDALKAASTAIDASRPLLDQTNQIEQFFELAGKVLRNMTGTTR